MPSLDDQVRLERLKEVNRHLKRALDECHSMLDPDKRFVLQSNQDNEPLRRGLRR